MKNMKNLPYRTTTTMINDFILHTMEHESSGCDRKDFTYGLLVGMFERVITDNHLSEVQLNSMKIVRRNKVESGAGP